MIAECGLLRKTDARHGEDVGDSANFLTFVSN